MERFIYLFIEVPTVNTQTHNLCTFVYGFEYKIDMNFWDTYFFLKIQVQILALQYVQVTGNCMQEIM